MIGNIGSADGSEKNGIVFLQDLDVVCGHVAPRLLVSIRRPVEIGEFVSRVAQFFGNGVDDLYSRVNDFWADTIRADLRDLVDTLPLGCARSCVSVRPRIKSSNVRLLTRSGIAFRVSVGRSAGLDVGGHGGDG